MEEWERRTSRVGNLAQFLAAQDEAGLYLSVVTLAELRCGVDRLAPGRRRTLLDNWPLTELPVRFAGRLLGIDAGDRQCLGTPDRQARTRGPADERDGRLDRCAADVRGLTLVTHNTTDFADAVARIVSRWTAD
jgi:predicted nucleic acid-binding protein